MMIIIRTMVIIPKYIQCLFLPVTMLSFFMSYPLNNSQMLTLSSIKYMIQWNIETLKSLSCVTQITYDESRIQTRSLWFQSTHTQLHHNSSFLCILVFESARDNVLWGSSFLHLCSLCRFSFLGWWLLLTAHN